MSTEDPNRLNELERRLARVEALLNLRAPAPPPPVPAPPPAAAPVQAPLPPAIIQATPAPTRAARPVAPAAKAAFEPDEDEEQPAKSPSIERSLGLHLAGWAGAAAVVISAGLGIKFAYEQGWFERFPPEARVLLMAFGGFLLIALGEWVYRRVNRYAASALFGSGVAVLFLVAYAGHAYYALYPPGTAFWLSGLATLIGAGLSVRGNLAAVALLAIFGGALAPLQLSTGAPPGEPLLIYVLLLQLLALYLAWWGNRAKWWALRLLSAFTNFVWFWVVIDGGAVNRHTMLGVTLFSASLFQSELIASSVRFTSGAKDAFSKSAHDSFSGVFSIGVTALLAAAGLWLLRDEARSMRIIWMFCLASVFAWQSFILPRLLGERARTLAGAFKIETALLVMLAVPVALNGNGIAAGWAIVGVALAWQARVQSAGPSLALATLTLLLAAGFWFFRELFEVDRGATRLLLFNAFTLNGTVLMTAFFIAGWLAERLSAGERIQRYSAVTVLLWGMIPLLFLWDGSCEIHRYFHPGATSWFDFTAAEQLAFSTFWALTSIALILLGFAVKGQALRLGGLALFALTLLKVVVVDGASLSSGYRVLSFLGVGALLIVTSVLYGKFKDS